MALIKFYKPALFRKDMDAVLQTMVDEKIGPGERKRAFVSSFCSFLGLSYGISLRTYNDMIQASLTALNIQSGDSVILSVLTPRVYLDVFKRLGVKPILVDVDDSMMVSAENSKKYIDQAKAIVYYEPLCQIPSSFEEIKSLNLPIIEDISESVGSSYGDIKAGMLGDIVICSTEEDNIISTAGGAVAMTNSEEFYENMRKYLGSSSSYLELPDMNAALGIVQLSNLENLISRRSNIYRIYSQAVMKSNCKMFGSRAVEFKPNGAGFAVIVNSRPDETVEFAKKYQITVKKTFSHSIGSRYMDRFDLYPKAIPALTRAISFPLYPFLQGSDIDTIQKVLSHIH